MGISLKPEHLKRYRDIGWLFMKYGRSDLVKQAGLDEVLAREEEGGPASSLAEPKAEELASDFEKMGPTFIKLAQLLSTRADLLPIPYLEALSRLQDNVAPFSFVEVEEIVTAELGVRISKGFLTFEEAPIAAASLGQVHRASLRDGREVVVKVQRPGIREQIVKDLEVLGDIAQFLDDHTEMGKRYEFQNMLGEFRKSLMRELDYRQEARHLEIFDQNLRDFKSIIVPLPIEDYTTSRVLTMEYIRGKKITSLNPLVWVDVDGVRLAEDLFHAYLQQILLDGFFHADPHPGNVFLTDDHRIALIDLGMVGHISPSRQEEILKLLMAISSGHGDDAAEQTINMGEAKPGFDEQSFRRQVTDLVTEHQDTNVAEIDTGRVVLDIQRIAGEASFRLPPEFTMIAKMLLNLDQVVHTLDPAFDPNASIRRHAGDMMQQRVLKSLSPANLFNAVMETKGFIEKLPARLNRFLDAVSRDEIKFTVDAIDETLLMEGLQKIANRITMGLVLAALIVGSAMLMRVETSFRIMGYPGFAIIFFMIAAGFGIVLVINILYNDEKAKRDGKPPK
ncbi:MAG: ubiquinone biosynthesis protein [Blastocatellia bacterium]|jgi:predicted unusual protein kinase regulating ubiquinone biosynthesis (AarF/ABC1/UbiB family)|nr:ubiquinone biosynthesis protein [Blastocatellia bacterium]